MPLFRTALSFGVSESHGSLALVVVRRFASVGRFFRRVGFGLTGLAVVLNASPVFGADFPTRSVRVVVDNPPGSTADIYARLLARHLSDALGQPFVIDNRPGAGGLIAAEEVLKAAPDGYTALYGGLNTLVTIPAVGGRIRFDPKAAFIPVAAGPIGYQLIAASNRLEVRSLDGLPAYSRRAAAPLTCATNGNGSFSHFSCAALGRALGINLTMVPYKGTTFAMQDAVAGHIDLVPAFSSEAASFLEGDRLKALAVLGPDRIPRVATVPTMAELGFPGHELTAFGGLYFPAGTPNEIVQIVNRAVVKAMQQADVGEMLKVGGARTLAFDAKEFAAFVAAQQAKWKQLADSAGIKADPN